jgi:hypothetical protein
MQPGDTPQPFIPPPPGQPPSYPFYPPYPPYAPPPRRRTGEILALILATLGAFFFCWPGLLIAYLMVYNDDPMQPRYAYQDTAVNLAFLGYVVGCVTVGLVARAIAIRQWRLALGAVAATLAIIVAFFVVIAFGEHTHGL